jgi:hypothetical protein
MQKTIGEHIRRRESGRGESACRQSCLRMVERAQRLFSNWPLPARMVNARLANDVTRARMFRQSCVNNVNIRQKIDRGASPR